MTALLTSNGISPIFINRLAEEQQRALVSFASSTKYAVYNDWKNTDAMPPAVQPFAKVVAAKAESFTTWGATIDPVDSLNRIRFMSVHVEKGETTFRGEPPIHADFRHALRDFFDRGVLHLRVLCVSSFSANFVDLTAQENMAAILDQYRINYGRAFTPELLEDKHVRNQLVTFGNWDIGIFDGATPHSLN
jgi:hypothetical protein